MNSLQEPTNEEFLDGDLSEELLDGELSEEELNIIAAGLFDLTFPANSVLPTASPSRGN